MANPSMPKIPFGFYVYEIVVDGVTRYVGKGCGERFKEHFRTVRRIIRVRSAGGTIKTSRFYNRLTRSFVSGAHIAVQLVASDLTEVDALLLERTEIARSRPVRLWNTYEGGEGFNSEWVKDWWRDPCNRARKSAESKANWNNIGYRTNQEIVRRSPEHQARVSETLKAVLASPDIRKKMSEAKIKMFSDPEQKLAFKERMKLCRQDPEMRRKMSNAAKALWANPEYRAQMSERHKQSRSRPEARKAMSERTKAQMTPERRKQISDCLKEKWKDPAFKAQALAKLHKLPLL